MIDPYHVSLGLRSKPKMPKKVKNSSKTSPCSSSSSAAQHHSINILNSSYAITPTSNTNTQDSSSGSTMAGPNPTIEQRLPELEHFKQSVPMLERLNPRTSEFFSLGKRTSSTCKPSYNSDSSSASSPIVAPPIGGAPRTHGAPPPQSASKLPIQFTDPPHLVNQPLPIRLGLAPPSGQATQPFLLLHPYKARVGHGYYFCLAPPKSSFAGDSISLTSLADGSKSNATPSEFSVSSKYSSASGPFSGSVTNSSIGSSSPGIGPDSSHSIMSEWNAVNTFDSNIYSSRSVYSDPTQPRSNTVAGTAPLTTIVTKPSSNHMSSSSTLSPSSSAWDLMSYFTTFKSRSKGRIHEYKHHAFPRSVVPYWLGYDAEAMEAEHVCHLSSLFSLNNSHTLREFPKGSRPARVLDLGCGQGMWCLDLARQWSNSEFIGLDVCPVQTPTTYLANPDLEKRVNWVVANFLEPLPFPDNSFDYVHMRFLQQAIPEDKWADVISEAERVLAPGGVLEVLESNYNFFGYPSLIDSQELKDLESGKTAHKSGSQPKLPKRLKVLNDLPGLHDFESVEIVVERMMHRRFINPHPLSIIPSNLLTAGLSNVANGNPRHIPLYVESLRQRNRAHHHLGESCSSTTASSEDEETWKGKFTNRTQIGNPLNSVFHVHDLDLFRAYALMKVCRAFSSSREMIWLEAEEEKRQILSTSHTSLETSATDHHPPHHRGFGQGHPAALEPFAHPWKSKAEFFQAMDIWLDFVLGKSDMDELLQKYLGWEDGGEDLTVEARKHAERQRKMSLGIPKSPVGEILYQGSIDSRMVGTLPKLATVASSHEAPGRLQTTPGSTLETEDDGSQEVLKDQEDGSNNHNHNGNGNKSQVSKMSSKTDQKKWRRKTTGRPSSSGGVDMSVAGYPFARVSLGETGIMGTLAFTSPMDSRASILARPVLRPQRCASESSSKSRTHSNVKFNDRTTDSTTDNRKKNKSIITTSSKNDTDRWESKNLPPLPFPLTATEILKRQSEMAEKEQEIRLQSDSVSSPVEQQPVSILNKSVSANTSSVSFVTTRSSSTTVELGGGGEEFKSKKKIQRPIAIFGFYDTTGFIANAA